jgi:glycosyltransferase involved in cell wall biosynthesis
VGRFRALGLVGGLAEAAMILSIVIPVLNEAATLPELIRRIGRAVPEEVDYEIIFVNDGSTDPTGELLRSFAREDKRIKSLHFARNFGHQAAFAAGLDAAAGDAVLLMDGDLQDAPEMIPAFLARWREGYEVVYAVRIRRQEGWLKRLGYKTFYRMLAAISQVETPLDSGDFSLMDRRAVDILKAMPEQPRFLRGLRSWVGFRQTGVEVWRDPRYAGRSKYTLRRLMRLAFDGFFSLSYRPLQLASFMGLMAAAVALLLAVALMILKVVHGIPLLGWTSLMVGVLFLGGVQLICLGILGEYVARIYDETRGRPPYVIASVVGDVRAPGSPGTIRRE